MRTGNTLQTLIASLATYGPRPAIVALSKAALQTWSYAQLADQVLRLAAGLGEAGVGPGDPVVMFAENSPEWMMAALAVVAAGAVVTPVDAQFGDELLGHILADSGARWIFTTADQTQRLAALALDHRLQLILLDAAADDRQSWRQLLAAECHALPVPTLGATATLFYTSGTTGRPKGVPLSHTNLVFQIETVIQARIVGDTDRVLLPLPLHHVYPFVMGMLAPLALGLPIILPQALTGPQIVRALREGEVTLMIGVPRLYEALVAGIEEQLQLRGGGAAMLFKATFGLSNWLRRRLGLRVGRVLLRSLHRQFGPQLRTLTSGGAALDPDLAWKLEGFGWRVGVGYGLTETAPLLTLDPPGRARIGSVGRPVSGVELCVDHTVRGGGSEEIAPAHPKRTTAPGQQGEVLARGPNVFSGYLHLPAETAKVFGDGWFRTGDLGYFDQDGYLYLLGRVSTMIVLPGGENIQPEDVEERYAEHPLIGEIGIFEQGGRLVALIVPEVSEIRRGNLAVEQAIRQAVAEQSRRLPSYQRISDYVITRHALPRTRLGKIRHYLLAARYAEAKAEQAQAAEEARPITPAEMSAEDRALLENPLARQLWEWLAERYADRTLTLDTSPQLDLGVDSLAWVEITMQISQRFGVELSDEAIGRVDTVRDLLREVSLAAGQPANVAFVLDEPEERLNAAQKRWLTPLGPGMTMLARIVYTCDGLLIRSLFQLEVQGLAHLPAQGPFILTPNHSSYLDSLAVASALGYPRLRNVYWAGSVAVMFINPLLRLTSRLSQTVPIATGQEGAFSSLAFAAAVLKRNKILVWFPEGQRSHTGRLLPFKPGIGLLLAHEPVPVIPVLIQGTYQALPPGWHLPRIGQRITITFGEPLSADKLAQIGAGEQPYERITDALHAQMVDLAGGRSVCSSLTR